MIRFFIGLTGIIAAADAGARVINLSLGGPDQDPVLDRACAYAFAKGAVVVAAGGNSYLTGNEVQYPAASPNVLLLELKPEPSPMQNDIVSDPIVMEGGFLAVRDGPGLGITVDEAAVRRYTFD